jgi:hypothetical protein
MMKDDSGHTTHGHAGNASAKRRPSMRAVFTNMKVKMPLRRKLYLVFLNNWIKIRTRQNCCGHLGEPGC